MWFYVALAIVSTCYVSDLIFLSISACLATLLHKPAEYEKQCLRNAPSKAKKRAAAKQSASNKDAPNKPANGVVQRIKFATLGSPTKDTEDVEKGSTKPKTPRVELKAKQSDMEEVQGAWDAISRKQEDVARKATADSAKILSAKNGDVSSSDGSQDGSPKHKDQTRTISIDESPSCQGVAPEHAYLLPMYDTFPMVVVQVPMYNERAYAERIITKCCGISWPKGRMVVQVCDDSTDESIIQKVKECVERLQEEGYPVVRQRRPDRKGFKAGAMVAGMKAIEGQGFEYVAIFDADFDPPGDFLLRTVIHMVKNPKYCFVQTRWTFTNGSENLLARCQKINLDFHFIVEQRARAWLGHFYGFNGTGGVWRLAAIDDAGGWSSDTVVEDMDLSLRAYLKGWRGFYVHDVHCPSELPSSMSAYKTQQFRWLSGPMQIIRDSIVNIWTAPSLSLWQKLNCYWFFLRYVNNAVAGVGVLLFPAVVMFLDPWHWNVWCIWYFVAINSPTLIYGCFSIFGIVYVFFSVVSAYFKLWAMFSGLLGLKKSKTWKVTAKLGAAQSRKMEFHYPYMLEAILSLIYGGFLGVAIWLQYWTLVVYLAVVMIGFIGMSFGDYLF